MGGNLFVRCECGVSLASDISRQFEYGVLKDGLKLRDWLVGLQPAPIPWGPTEIDHVTPAAEFVAWHDETMRLLTEHRYALPTLHQIWRTSSSGRTGSARGYLEWDGRCWYVDADDAKEVVLTEVAREVFDESVACETMIRPSCVAKLDPGGAKKLVRRSDGTIVMPAEVFDRTFESTGIELDRANLLEYWSDEFADLTMTADHARTCGRPLHMNYG